jgi:hypothetical protein
MISIAWLSLPPTTLRAMAAHTEADDTACLRWERALGYVFALCVAVAAVAVAFATG